MCSYCGCEALVPIGRFMAEHVEIVEALAALCAAMGSTDEARRRAADALEAQLDPHAEAEEAGLFAVLSRQEEFSAHIRRLCGEHTDLAARLALIRDGQLEGLDDFVMALRNHIDREENGLFPAAAIALSGPDWEEVVAFTPPGG